MTCGNEHERITQWYPPANIKKNYSYHPHDTPYVYDIKVIIYIIINFLKGNSITSFFIYLFRPTR